MTFTFILHQTIIYSFFAKLYIMKRPENDEYAAFYAGYVSLVTETDPIFAMKHQLDELRSLISRIPEEMENHAYGEGKWTIREVIGHLIDGERVFSYRAARISRGDKTPLASFSENSYVENSAFKHTSLAQLFEEFSFLRQSNLLLFRNMPEKAWDEIGIASDSAISVKALAFIMVGHVRHHLKILRERYLA